MISAAPAYGLDYLQRKWIVPKIKVLLLSIHYPLAMKSYFERALRRRDDVELLTTGPYTSTYIPWMGGMNLPDKYATPPDIPLPFAPNVGKVNYELVKPNLPAGWIPDLVLTVDAGIRWRYKPTDGYVAHVATDPHAIPVSDYDHARSYSDKFFNMQAVYSKPQDVYLPYAFDPSVHFPDDFVSKDADAVLIGMPYQERVKWVNELRRRGVSVLFENGPVFDEYRQINNRARIGLNWSSLDDLNARAFELPAMKLCPVMNRVSDMSRFKFTEYCHIFDTFEEAVEKVIWCKENLDETLGRANMAYNAVQGETYDARVSQLLKECGFA